MGVRESIERFLEEHPAYKELVERYIPNKEAIQQIKEGPDDVKVVVFYGDWCPDCRLQLPAFMSVMLEVDNEKANIKFIEMNRSKEEPSGEAEKHNVRALPSFIFLQGDKEIGRIIERPKTTIEGDIAAMIVN